VRLYLRAFLGPNAGIVTGTVCGRPFVGREIPTYRDQRKRIQP
jgi:hypothetical protein